MATKKPTKIDDPGMMAEIGAVPMQKEMLEKMSMNPYDQLFMCRLMSMRDDAIKEDLEDLLKDTRADDIKSISSDICSQMAEVLSPIQLRLESIDAGIKEIKSRLEELEEQLQVVKQEVHTEDQRIASLERTQKWWNIGFRIAIAVAISTIIALLIHYNLPTPH